MVPGTTQLFGWYHGVLMNSILFINFYIMKRKSIYNNLGKFMGYCYVDKWGGRLYAPTNGVTNCKLSAYCDMQLV